MNPKKQNEPLTKLFPFDKLWDGLSQAQIQEERKRLTEKRPSELIEPMSPDAQEWINFEDYEKSVKAFLSMAKESFRAEEQRARNGDPSAQLEIGRKVIKRALKFQAYCDSVNRRRDKWLKYGFIDEPSFEPRFDKK